MILRNIKKISSPFVLNLCNDFISSIVKREEKSVFLPTEPRYTDFCRIILLLSLGACFGNTLVIVLTIGGALDFVQCGLLSDDSCPCLLSVDLVYMNDIDLISKPKLLSINIFIPPLSGCRTSTLATKVCAPPYTKPILSPLATINSYRNEQAAAARLHADTECTTIRCLLHGLRRL